MQDERNITIEDMVAQYCAIMLLHDIVGKSRSEDQPKAAVERQAERLINIISLQTQIEPELIQFAKSQGITLQELVRRKCESASPTWRKKVVTIMESL